MIHLGSYTLAKYIPASDLETFNNINVIADIITSALHYSSNEKRPKLQIDIPFAAVPTQLLSLNKQITPITLDHSEKTATDSEPEAHITGGKWCYYQGIHEISFTHMKQWLCTNDIHTMVFEGVSFASAGTSHAIPCNMMLGNTRTQFRCSRSYCLKVAIPLHVNPTQL